MSYTIYSRKLRKHVTFSLPSVRAGYVFVDLNDKPGTLGLQICKGGQLYR